MIKFITRAFVLFFLFLSTHSLSQNDLISFKDSIQNLSFKELSKNYYREEDSLRIITINNEFLKDIEEAKYSNEEIVSAYQYIYFWKTKINDKKSCIYYASLALAVAEKTNNQNAQCLAANMMGFNYSSLDNYRLALKNYTKALKIAEDTNNNFMSAAIKTNIGSLKIASNDINGGIIMIESVIKEIKSKKNKNAENFYPKIYSILTDAYLKNENYEQAKIYNNLAKESQKKSLSKFNESMLSDANIEIHIGNYDRALEILNEFEKKTDQAFFIENAVAMHFYKGKAYFLKQNYTTAIKELLIVDKLNKENLINQLDFEELYELLGNSYKKIKKKDSSLTYFEKALSVYSKNEKAQIQLIASIASEYDDKEFDKELKKRELYSSKLNYEKHLILQKERDSLYITKNNQETYLIFGSVFIIFLFCVTGITAYTYNKKNKKKFNQILHELEGRKKYLNIDQTSNSKKSVQKNIKKETVNNILEGLKKLEIKEYYLKKECSTHSIAKKLKTNTSYLSKIIKTHYNCNFSTYINNLRINYAITRLKDDTVFRSYSIQSIAEELGYKSSDSFLKYFKERTGLVPSYYIKKLNRMN
jgi:YesN/AraC family two-component response regulator